MSIPTELGTLLDSWVNSGRVVVVETTQAVTVGRLDAKLTRELLVAVRPLAWQCDVQDAGGEITHPDSIEDDFGPFVATIRKSEGGGDRHVLTLAGFSQALAEKASGGVWQIACAHVSFTTGTTAFFPWGGGDVFSPAASTKSPLDVVREANEERLVPADIRKWVMRGNVTNALWQDSAFHTFAVSSIPALIRSLASEVVGRESVVFNGPPRLNIKLSQGDLIQEFSMDGYQHLQAAVAWVYEDGPSTEQRHALFAAEFARSVTRDESIGKAFRTAGRDILEGARLAFGLSQSDLSREAIKALADLRKAIVDDTTKAAEGTRTLSAAIAVAIATGITLVAGKSTGVAESWILSFVAAVAALYLIAVTVSGFMHLKLQENLREQWRRQFYRFIPSDDYEIMVVKPTRAAEKPYRFVALIAFLVAFILLYIAFIGLGTEVQPKPIIGTSVTGQGATATENLTKLAEPTLTAPPKNENNSKN